MKYDAFLSYSQAVDTRLAPAIQNALHQFAKKWLSLRTIRVFRDKTTLSSTPGLWPSIQSALSDSRYFILLASPDAASSPWVEREVRFWLEKDTEVSKLLLVLTTGEICWNPDTKDFDWKRTTALPRALAEKFSAEPLYVDLRWARQREHVSLKNAEFASAIASLSSAIRGIPKDDLFGTDVREHRKRKSFFSGAIILLVVFALGMVFLFFESERRRKTTLAGKLSAQSSMVRNDRPSEIELAVLLAIEAQRRADSPEGHAMLLKGLEVLPDHLKDLEDSRGPLTGSFSTDGRRFAAGFADGSVKVWETERWSLIFSTNANSPVRDVAFNNGGTLVAFAEEGGGACIWNVGRRAEQLCVEHNPPLTSVGFDPEGKRLLTVTSDLVSKEATENCVRVWDTTDGKELHPMCHDEAVVNAFFLGEGEVIVSGSKDGSVRVWDALSGQEIRRLVDTSTSTLDGVTAMAIGRQRGTFAVATFGTVRAWKSDGFGEVLSTALGNMNVSLAVKESDSGDVVASGSADGTVRVFLTKSNTETSVKLPFNATNVAINPEMDYFVAGTDHGIVSLWQSFGLPRLRARIPTDGSTNATVLAYDPSGDQLVVGTEYGERLRVWKGWQEDRYLRIGHGKAKKVQNFAFHPFREKMITATEDEIVLWDYSQKPPFQQFVIATPQPVRDLSINHDGSLLAAAYGESVFLWDMETGDKRAQLKVPTSPLSVTFSGEGSLIAVALEGSSLKIYDGRDGKEVGNIKYVESVSQIRFSSEGRYMAVLLADGPVYLYETSQLEQPVKSLEGVDDTRIFAIAFHPADQELIGATEHGVVVWGLRKGKVLRRLSKNWTWKIALSNDGKIIVVDEEEGGHGRPVSVPRFLEWSSGKEQFQMSDVLNQGFMFSPDGKYFAYNDFGEVVLIPWESETVVEAACDRMTRNLTEDEWERYLTGESYRLTCPNIADRE